MRKALKKIYYFLPVQLLLLHFRKYQLLLVFWLIIIATVTGNFASQFGASTLFLAPEYIGNIGFGSMFMLGSTTAVFIMAWHITTFIIHSHRIPYVGATRHAFIIYCINNSLLPLAFLIFYSILSIRFQVYDEHTEASKILLLQLGFYTGVLIVVSVSFLYFFRIGRDFLKNILTKITNPARIREIIPYDTLDYEIDILKAKTYLSDKLKIEELPKLETYNLRLLNTILRRHHRNAIFATIFAYVTLLLMGIFMEDPVWRIPAGASFLFLFAIAMGLVGAVKYFLRSWETLGWIAFAITLSLLVKYSFFDLRSVAYGLDYNKVLNHPEPKYDYDYIYHLFTPARYEADRKQEEGRLDKWKKKVADSTKKKPTLVVITISGGGARSAYWAFRALQYADSLSKGKLFNNTVFITGASGGTIGGAYWRGIHDEYKKGKIKDPYDARYQENIGKDLLNAIIFSFASIDLVSPYSKVYSGGYHYSRDRGYALEQELIKNTEGILDKKLWDYKDREANASIPQMVVNSTIINDGRRLMISAQPITYLTQPAYSLKNNASPPIDAIDFAAFFAGQNPYNLRMVSALRMNATFPIILPVVKLPSVPRMNIMDAGLRDNFGSEITTRYLFTLREWIQKNAGDVVFLEIRDTREYEMHTPSVESTLGQMLTDPLFAIQDKWEVFQSYHHGYIKDFSPYFMTNKLHFIPLQYLPREQLKTAKLNFHLTQREKEDILFSIDHPVNQQAIKELLQLLH